MRRGRVGLSVNGNPGPREWACAFRCTGMIVHNTMKGQAAVMRYGYGQGNSSRGESGSGTETMPRTSLLVRDWES